MTAVGRTRKFGKPLSKRLPSHNSRYSACEVKYWSDPRLRHRYQWDTRRTPYQGLRTKYELEGHRTEYTALAKYVGDAFSLSPWTGANYTFSRQQRVVQCEPGNGAESICFLQSAMRIRLCDHRGVWKPHDNDVFRCGCITPAAARKRRGLRCCLAPGRGVRRHRHQPDLRVSRVVEGSRRQPVRDDGPRRSFARLLGHRTRCRSEYVVFVMRAITRAEGGTMALLSLVLPWGEGSKRALVVGLAGHHFSLATR